MPLHVALKPAQHVAVVAGIPGSEQRHQGISGRCCDQSLGGELVGDPFAAHLVELVERDQHFAVTGRRNSSGLEQPGQRLPMIETNDEVVETKPLKHLGRRAQQLRFDHQRRRSNRVDVALIELAKPPFLRTIGSPNRLNLVTFERKFNFVLVLYHVTRERNS